MINKKLLLSVIIVSMIFQITGCKNHAEIKLQAVALPENIEWVNKSSDAKVEALHLQNSVIVRFNRDITGAYRGNVLLDSNGIWSELKCIADKNKLAIDLPKENMFSSNSAFTIVIPKDALSGLKNDIYMEFGYRNEPFEPINGIVPVLKSQNSEEIGMFCNSSVCKLTKDVFFEKHAPFIVNNEIELHNGDDFKMESPDKGLMTVIESGIKKQIEFTIDKKYVYLIPPPLNKKSSYFTYSKKLEGYVIEEIFSRKDSWKIKYVPYFPHIFVNSFPGTGSDFTLFSANIFPLTSQDIGVMELSDFEMGLRSEIHPPDFYGLMHFSSDELDAILRYEKFFKKQGEEMIDNFIFPDCLRYIKKPMKDLFDKDVELSVIYVSHIKELKQTGINAEWLNSLIADFANNVGKTAEEKQKIKVLFHYPFSENFSINEERDVLNTNSKAWLYLLNSGNFEVSDAISKELKRILNR